MENEKIYMPTPDGEKPIQAKCSVSEGSFVFGEPEIKQEQEQEEGEVSE